MRQCLEAFEVSDRESVLLPGNLRNLEKGALEKVHLHKIVRNLLSNSRQMCDNFAKGNSRNYVQIWRAICENLRSAHLANAPFSGFLRIALENCDMLDCKKHSGHLSVLLGRWLKLSKTVL